MAKIKNIVLSEAQNREVLKILQSIPNNQLHCFKNLVKDLPDNLDLNVLRTQLEKRLMEDDCELDETHVDILFKHSTYRNLFKFIDADYIKENAGKFAALIGKEMFEVMILISSKAEELLKLVNNITPAKKEKVEEFKQEFIRYFKKYIFQPLGFQFGDSESSKIAQLNARIVELERQISIYETRINKIIQSHSEELQRIKQSQQNEIQTRDSQIVNYRKEIDSLQKNLKGIKDNYENLQKEFNALKENFRERVNSEARRQFTELIRNVFPNYEPTNTGDNGSQSVAVQARKALQAQAEYDRIYGTRVELERQLKDLIEIRDAIHLAFKNSLNVKSDLFDIIKKVEEEISKIQDKLGIIIPPVLNNIFTLLTGVIDRDINPEGLNKLWETAGYLNDIGLISQDELKDIQRRIYARYQIITIREPDKARETGFALLRCLKENLNSVVIFDAHNIINNDELKRYFYSEDHGQSRNNLIEVVKKIAKERGNVQFKIVFDGSDYRVVNADQNVEIYYSGGVGEQRADNFIIENINTGRFISTDAKHFIVSDDLGLVSEAAKFNFIRVQLSLFEYILKEFKVV
ncbi:MAG: hypothetical protein ACP5K7_04015 [Verrucomicrobiia bacterium]